MFGMPPSEVWSLELWEFNNYILGCRDRQKNETATAILTGYYSAYYTNGGKKSKNPKELIDRLFAKKQSLEQGLADIARIREEKKRSQDREIKTPK